MTYPTLTALTAAVVLGLTACAGNDTREVEVVDVATPAATTTYTTTTTTALPAFPTIDLDNDGYVVRTDLAGNRYITYFDTYDIDRDGRLSKVEYETWLVADRDGSLSVKTTPATDRRSFAAMDLDGNGKLTRDEIRAEDPALSGRFENFDQDGDNTLSQAEFEIWFAGVEPEEFGGDVDREDNELETDMHQ